MNLFLLLLLQVTGANLTGTVLGPPAATVTAKNLTTGVVRQVATNSSGFYVIPNLPPSDYSVTVSAEGFASQTRPHIELTVGAIETLDFKLQLGTVEQKVDVEAKEDNPVALVSGLQARELPLNGRDWTQLATLESGVAQIRTQPDANGVSNRGSRGFGTQLSVSGGRPQQNSYRLDGIGLNDYAGGGPGDVIGLSLGVEAIEEFSVVTGNIPAAYGQSSGGVLNAVTRSGTAAFHGSVYEFLRNDALDARNFFDGAKSPFRRNQFGGAAGGPLRRGKTFRGKTFFFANYEALRQVLSVPASANVLSPAARTGQLSTGKVNINPLVAPYLNFWPLANGPVTGDSAIYNFRSKSFTPEQFATIRVDHVISSRDNLHGTYLFDQSQTNAPDALNVTENSNWMRRQLATVEENHVFSPQWFNSARLGVSRVAANTLASSAGANPLGSDTTLGVAPGLYAPGIQVSPLTNFQGGLNGLAASSYGFTTYQFYDDAFWSHGAHSVKFGATFERIQSNLLQNSNQDGVFKFNNLAGFLQDQPAASFQIQLGAASERGLRQSVGGLYLLDDIRVRPNLTVNIGVRYEPASVPTEVHGMLANLRTLTATQISTGDPLFNNPTLRDFEPRAGFSWVPFGNGRTVVRSSFGIFDLLPLTYQFNMFAGFSAPYFQMLSSSALTAGSFPTGALKLAQAGGQQRVAYVDYNPGRDYVMQSNFYVQQEIVHDLTLSVGYNGSHGVHQPFRSTDANVVLPSITPQGLLWPCGGVINAAGVCTKTATGTQLNPAFGQIDAQQWSASSVYDALLVDVKKRFRHGFQLQGAFTWAKSLDTNSSLGIGAPFSNSLASQLFFAPMRGPSDFDVPRNLVLNAVWDIRGGWQLSGLFQASDGLPFTAVVAGDALGMRNNGPFDVPNRLSTAGCDNPVNPGNPNSYIKTACFAMPNPSTLLGNEGRNQIFGPGLVNTDVSVSKSLRLRILGESGRVQIRADLFNLANHANFAPPLTNNKLYMVSTTAVTAVATAGQITSAAPPRQVQVGLKLAW
jgi:hypothetical protein